MDLSKSLTKFLIMFNFQHAKSVLANEFGNFDLGAVTPFLESAWSVGDILLRRRSITSLPEWALRDIVLNLAGSYRTAEVERWLKALLAFITYRSEILGKKDLESDGKHSYVMPRVIRKVLRRAEKAEKAINK